MFKNFVRVEFEDGGTYDIPKANVPNYLSVGGEYYCTLSSDTTRLFSAKINKGTHIVGFIGFKREDQLSDPPYPVEKTIKWVDKETRENRSRTYESFIALHHVLNGDHVGMVLWGELEYRFVEVDDEDEGAIAGIYGRGTAANMLEGWIEAAGMDLDVESLPWSENLLPDLEGDILQRARPYQLSFGPRGYIDSYSLILDELMGDYRKQLRKVHKETAKRAAQWEAEQAAKNK
jgi:hypothetical protein